MPFIGCPAFRDTFMKLSIRAAFGNALNDVRLARALAQEDFSGVSSRTYVSMLERGVRSATLDKVEALASQLRVHPLTLLTLAYLKAEGGEVAQLQNLVRTELRAIATAAPPARGSRREAAKRRRLPRRRRLDK